MDKHFILTLIFIILTQYTPPHVETRSSFQSNTLVSYSIPQKRPLKKALGFDEDTYLNFTELTTKYDFPTEVHTVTTEDGYILSVFRILSKCSETKAFPILLMHGLFDTSDVWIVPGPKGGIGFYLAQNCFDVWTPNSRGSPYSRRHVKLDPNTDAKFWNFTFNELGYFDVPAAIDHILLKTGQSKLAYMGHSQGSTQFFVMGSLKPEYNDKIALAIQLAPVAYLKNVMDPLFKIIARHYEAILSFAESAGLYEIFARDHIVHLIFEYMCQFSPQLCEIGLTLATGYKSGTIDSHYIPIYFSHLFSGTSIKNLAHFAQLLLSGRFQKYDEGREGNIKRYSTTRTPQYNVSLVRSPIVLISALSDNISTQKDLDILVQKLPNLVENYIVPEPYWSHHNSIWGNNSPEIVFPKIMDYLKKYIG